MCGFDKIQILGGFLHQFTRPFDAAFQLILRHVGDNRIGSSCHRTGSLGICLRLFAGRFCVTVHQNVGPVLLDLLRSDAVRFVVSQLLLTASVGLVDGLLHAVCYLVGIHDDLSVYVTGCSACRLGE